MSVMHAMCKRFTVKVLRRKFGNKRHVVIDNNRHRSSSAIAESAVASSPYAIGVVG